MSFIATYSMYNTTTDQYWMAGVVFAVSTFIDLIFLELCIAHMLEQTLRKEEEEFESLIRFIKYRGYYEE